MQQNGYFKFLDTDYQYREYEVLNVIKLSKPTKSISNKELCDMKVKKIVFIRKISITFQTFSHKFCKIYTLIG